MNRYFDKYDAMRPCADHPVLTGDVAAILNQLWVDAAWACNWHLYENGAGDMNREELCLAVSADLMGEVPNGGTRQWLLWNMHRPDVAVHAVEALRHMGSHGMAAFIERIIETYLGPRDAWVGLSPDAWREYQLQREALLEERSPYAVGVSAKASLTDMGMDRDAFLDFHFESQRLLAEKGDIDRYQQWYDSHATAVPDKRTVKFSWSTLHTLYTRFAKKPEPGQPVLSSELHVLFGAGGDGIYCHPFSDPHTAGMEGFWYWEKELEAKCYEFTRDNLDKIRPTLHKLDS